MNKLNATSKSHVYGKIHLLGTCIWTRINFNAMEGYPITSDLQSLLMESLLRHEGYVLVFLLIMFVEVAIVNVIIHL